ncbi:amidohydrolase family protein [Streptomyces mayteni]
MEFDTVVALVRAGRAAGLRTIARAITLSDIEIALDAGVDGLAHVYCDTGPEAERVARRIVAAATSEPARHFGLTDRGRIAPGLRADLLLVHGDPTTDSTATSAIADVWRRGVRCGG